jgi:hypothetical protein
LALADFEPLLRVTACAKSVSELSDFIGRKRFVQNDHPIRLAQALEEIGPGIIRESRADDDLLIRVMLPNVLNGGYSITAGWHPDVDHHQIIRAARGSCGVDHPEGFLALQRAIDLKSNGRLFCGNFVEQHRIGLRPGDQALARRSQNTAKVLVNSRVVVRDEDTVES